MRYQISFILYLLLSLVSVCFANQTILIVGDSLSSGHGIAYQDSWAAKLTQQVAQAPWNYQVINASISGQTTANAVQQFDKLIDEHQPHIVIIALGSNDGLRGLQLSIMQANLSKLINDSLINSSKVLLIGFKLPPNYGLSYAQEFSQVYTNLSKLHKVTLVPFLLEGFAADFNYFQTDGLHPNELAQPLILKNIWPFLEKLL